MTQAPTLTGQDIGLAHYATRALLERSLAEAGTSFVDWTTINAIATDGPIVDRAAVVARITGGLKIDEATAQAVLHELIDSGLVAHPTDDPSRVELSAAGEALVRRVRVAIDGITSVIYADLPSDELAAAHRVLVTVKERANAALAS